MNMIEIKEEVKIPGTDIILEKGDKIKFVTEETNDWYFLSNFDNVELPDGFENEFNKFYNKAGMPSDFDMALYGDALIFSDSDANKLKSLLSKFKIKDISDKVIKIGYPVPDDNKNETRWDRIENLLDKEYPVYSLINATMNDSSSEEDFIILDKTKTKLKKVSKKLKVDRFDIPDGVIEVCDEAFKSNQYNRYIKEIYIPDSVKIIGRLAFTCLFGLKHVIGGKGLSFIGAYAFESCSNLENMTFYEDLKEIGPGAFQHCNFKELKFPNSLKKLGQFAFYGNKELRSIDFPKSINELERSTFDSNDCEKIIVPSNIKKVYLSALQRDHVPTNIELSNGVKHVILDYGCYSDSPSGMIIKVPNSVDTFEVNKLCECTIEYDGTSKSFEKIVVSHKQAEITIIVNCTDGTFEYKLSDFNYVYMPESKSFSELNKLV